jgi:hypothetical protein
MPGFRGDTEPLIEAAPGQPATDSRRGAWHAGWATAAAVLTAFAIIALSNMQTGLQGDPRTTNPNPGIAPYPPFLGVTNWPLVASVTSVILTVAFFGYLSWQSIRRQSPHWLLIVGIAAFCAGALDPLANWATFTVFDPRVAHFPLSWPYFNASPLLEPTLSFVGGYASYYVLTGLGLLRSIGVSSNRACAGMAGWTAIGSLRCLSPDSLQDCRSTHSCSSCG